MAKIKIALVILFLSLIVLSCSHVEKQGLDLKRMIAEKNYQIDSLKTELQKINHQKGDLKRQIIQKRDSLQAEIKAGKSQLKSLDLRYQNLLARKSAKNKRLQDHIVVLREQRQNLQEKIDKYQAQIKNLSKRLDKQRKRDFKGLNKELEQAKKSIKEREDAMNSIIVIDLILIALLVIAALVSYLYFGKKS